jgi:hypothetical protein
MKGYILDAFQMNKSQFAVFHVFKYTHDTNLEI